MRRTRVVTIKALAMYGITSACAENTRSRRPMPFARWDHLRMCGEHFELGHSSKGGAGSPPHVRRTLCVPPNRYRPGGITSACAENTFAWCNGHARGGDHLRMCGEHIIDGHKLYDGPGSPPHVRRTRPHDEPRTIAEGITSACAENTIQAKDDGKPRRDHLRMCGEHSKQIPSQQASHNLKLPFFMSFVANVNVALASSSARCGFLFSISYSFKTVSNR